MSTLPSLNRETLWAILNDQIDDDTVNRLVWHFLGYRYDEAKGGWDAGGAPLDWQEAYPEPPDFINSRPATVKLTRSIPKEHKQLLKEDLGFRGYAVEELVPRRTRRATVTNWLLSCLRSQESQKS